jgi:hypothetical protein
VFQYIKDLAGNQIPDMIKYTDPDGTITFVPINHRIWVEIYEPWLAAGNTPLPAA